MTKRTLIDDINNILKQIQGRLYRYKKHILKLNHAYIINHPCQINHPQSNAPSEITLVGFYNLTMGRGWEPSFDTLCLNDFEPISRRDLNTKEAKNLRTYLQQQKHQPPQEYKSLSMFGGGTDDHDTHA